MKTDVKDGKTVRNILSQILEDIGAKNCHVWLGGYAPGVGHHLKITYTDEHKNEVFIDEYWLHNTILHDNEYFKVDLNDPWSIEQLRASIGVSYDIYAKKRWKVIISMPLIVGKYLWRTRKALKIEASDWLTGHFKPEKHGRKS